MHTPGNTTSRFAARRKRVGILGLLAATLAAAGLLAIVAPSAPAEVVGPVVVLGPTSVVNGTAIVSGTIAEPSSNVQLTINGRPISIAAGGQFTAVVDAAGQSSLTLSLTNPTTGRTATTSIPLNTNIVGPGGLLGPGILEGLKQAGVALLEPVGGLRITDGLPLRVEGTVADPSSLGSLKVNGTDVLSTLDSGRFSLVVPGTTKEITVTATDRQGVSHSETVPVVHSSSGPAARPATPGAATGRTVAAGAAEGVRIAKIRYITRTVRRTKRLRMVVTIKDRRGLLVRGATINVRSRFARRIVGKPRVKKTNRVGQAAFLLRARNRAFGKRLVMITVAKTPKAKASKRSSVRLPRLARAAARRR